MSTPGRNDPCPCGSGRKFKQCCLDAWSAEDAARRRIRAAEGHIVQTLLDYIGATWGEAFTYVAWEEFFLWDDVPDEFETTPEFDTMFLPWLTLGYVPDPHGDDRRPDWPVEPVGLHWLRVENPNVSDYERDYTRAACASPMSAFVVESVVPGRSVDLKDILTGRRFHVLEEGASKTLLRNDLAFTRVVTVAGTSVMFGLTPFVIPAEWHTHVIDFRESKTRRRLMTRADVARYNIEIRGLYLEIVAEILNPTPPRLTNDDGDTIEWATLTFDARGSVDEIVQRLAPLALAGPPRRGGKSATPARSGKSVAPTVPVVDDETRDEHGALTSASLTWVSTGSQTGPSNAPTVLGSLKISPGRIIAEVNSSQRATRLRERLAELLGPDATLVDSKVVDVATALAERAAARSTGVADDVDDAPEIEPTPEMLAMKEEVIRRHIEGWIERKIPALGNKTPRQAARSASGRERLAAILADYETRAAQLSPNAPRYVAELRTKLGIG